MATATLQYNGNNQQSWQVPGNMVGGKVTVELYGSPGQAASAGAQAPGGYVKGDLACAPGDTLYFNVGRQSPTSGTGGWPDAGSGNWGGGGSTDCRYGGTGQGSQVGVAAGGGGQGPGTAAGGNGGAATGQTGGNGSGGNGGGGGTQSAGGAAGTGGFNAGTAGSRYQGGAGGGGVGLQGYLPGGGGGGGYYGGGGGSGGGSGGSNGGAGGGGSNYVGGLTNTTTTRGVASPASDGNGFVRITYNVAPNAPTVTPHSGYYDFDQALAEQIDFVPDPQSAMASADVRWRVGTAAWTTITGAVSGAGTTYSFAAATFNAYTNQQVEVQVRTIDSSGGVGAWSSSIYLTPRVAPAAPVLSGLPSQIQTSSPTYTVGGSGGSSFNQYEARSVNDSAGSPGSTVYADTGIQSETTPQTSQQVNLPSYSYTNGTSYHLQARVASPAGVWSPWADSGALVTSINAPLTPTVVLTPYAATGSVIIQITNPAGGQAVASNQIYRTDLTTGVETLIAQNIPVNGNKTDWFVGYNRQYRYRVVAVGTNGATTSSA